MRGGGGRLGRGMEEWRKEEGGEKREATKGWDEGEIANGERSWKEWKGNGCCLTKE